MWFRHLSDYAIGQWFGVDFSLPLRMNVMRSLIPFQREITLIGPGGERRRATTQTDHPSQRGAGRRSPQQFPAPLLGDNDGRKISILAGVGKINGPRFVFRIVFNWRPLGPRLWAVLVLLRLPPLQICLPVLRCHRTPAEKVCTTRDAGRRAAHPRVRWGRDDGVPRCRRGIPWSASSRRIRFRFVRIPSTFECRVRLRGDAYRQTTLQSRSDGGLLVDAKVVSMAREERFSHTEMGRVTILKLHSTLTGNPNSETSCCARLVCKECWESIARPEATVRLIVGQQWQSLFEMMKWHFCVRKVCLRSCVEDVDSGHTKYHA